MMQDTVADMLTRIRNAQSARKVTVQMPCSKIKVAIAKVLKDEGYITDYVVMTNANKANLVITLKYYAGKAVIARLKRVSKPGLRVYSAANELPVVMNGLGIAIISSPKGVITNKQAQALNTGGEVLCLVE